MNEILPPENALSVITEKNAVQFFADKGLDPIIDKIRKEVAAFKPDITSEIGRKEIASFAYKISKMKTQTDELGKKLVSGIKAQAKIIDAERGRAWDAIEALQHEARKPLTEWETKEETRVNGHKTRLEEVQAMSLMFTTTNAEELTKRLEKLGEYENLDWQEFTDLAGDTMRSIRITLTAKIAELKKSEEDAAELKRLQLAERERQQKEHDEKIAKEASDRAKKESEEKASEEIAKSKREKEEADQRAEKAEADRKASEKKAEEDRIAAAKKAEHDRKAQEEKAKRDQDAAVEAERKRAADVKKKEEDDAKVREANKNHKKKINNEALAVLKNLVPEDKAKSIIEAIALGHVPHVKITY